jgi:hypothetical protein
MIPVLIGGAVALYGAYRLFGKKKSKGQVYGGSGQAYGGGGVGGATYNPAPGDKPSQVVTRFGVPLADFRLANGVNFVDVRKPLKLPPNAVDKGAIVGAMGSVSGGVHGDGSLFAGRSSEVMHGSQVGWDYRASRELSGGVDDALDAEIPVEKVIEAETIPTDDDPNISGNPYRRY